MLAADKRTLGVALVGLALLLLVLQFGTTIVWLVQRWTSSIWQDAHGMLIAPAVAWFSWQELRRFDGQPADANPLGFAFLVVGLGLNVIDAGAQTVLLAAIGLIALLPGLSLLLLGTTRTRAIAFPLAFSLFMLPIPLRFSEPIHLALRHVAAEGSGIVLSGMGVPNYLDGLTLHVARGAMYVADSCSGFSTLYAALAVAVLVAHSTPSWNRKLLVLVVAAPLAMLSNVVRVSLLGLLLHWYGTGVLDTWVHPASGMMTFALTLPALFWLGETATRRS